MAMMRLTLYCSYRYEAYFFDWHEKGKLHPDTTLLSDNGIGWTDTSIIIDKGKVKAK